MNGYRSWRTAALTMLLSAAIATDNSALAQAGPSEYDLKAAFIYQFLSYVSWPESKVGVNGVILIGVVGAPELVSNLTLLARTRGDDARMFDVLPLTLDANPAGLHVLFVAADINADAEDLLQAALADAVLTITEELPRPQNSVINFEIIGNKVRFDVALGMAQQNGLAISGRLLQVALRVMEQP